MSLKELRPYCKRKVTWRNNPKDTIFWQKKKLYGGKVYATTSVQNYLLYRLINANKPHNKNSNWKTILKTIFQLIIHHKQRSQSLKRVILQCILFLILYSRCFACVAYFVIAWYLWQRQKKKARNCIRFPNNDKKF